MKKLCFAALRGDINDQIYYSCLLTMKDIKTLWKPITIEFKKYKKEKKQGKKFFNSIVIAIYGGSPKWIQVEKIESSEKFNNELNLEISADVIENLGVLMLNGDEELFILDGINRLKEYNYNKDEDGKLSVIFVSYVDI